MLIINNFILLNKMKKVQNTIAMKLSLEFGELEIMTKETISQGM